MSLRYRKNLIVAAITLLVLIESWWLLEYEVRLDETAAWTVAAVLATIVLTFLAATTFASYDLESLRRSLKRYLSEWQWRLSTLEADEESVIARHRLMQDVNAELTEFDQRITELKRDAPVLNDFR